MNFLWLKVLSRDISIPLFSFSFSRFVFARRCRMRLSFRRSPALVATPRKRCSLLWRWTAATRTGWTTSATTSESECILFRFFFFYFFVRSCRCLQIEMWFRRSGHRFESPTDNTTPSRSRWNVLRSVLFQRFLMFIVRCKF